MLSIFSSFSIYIALGAGIGVWQVIRRSSESEVKRRIVYSWVVLLGILLGARLGHILLHLPYFRQHPVEILQIWNGGLDWMGALLGGLGSLCILWWVRREPSGRLADGMAPLALPLAAGAWLGCWDSGCAYGAPLNAFPGMVFPDELGILARRFPLQFLAVLLLVLFSAWLEIRPPRLTQAGQYASLVGLGLGGVMLLTAFMRAAPAPRWAGLRPDVWVALFFLVFCLVAGWRCNLIKKGAV